MTKIGTLGLSFGSGNKGCEALAYSFLEIVERIAAKRGENIQVDFIKPLPSKQILKKRSIKAVKKNYFPNNSYPHLQFDVKFYVYRGGRVFFLNSIKSCCCVFDFTDGDSFTDIYGKERFFSRTRVKKAVIDKKVPFVLGSQTIGPFKDENVKKFAVEVIKGAYEVYVRDKMSFDYTLSISGRKPLLTTDIAFVLPFETVKFSGDKKRIGFNASGLLWNGGYTRDNQFGLKVDYREYCRSVISAFLKEGNEVHLILHAYTQNKSSMDNDLTAAEELHKEFPETVISPQFTTPMEAKGYIAGMDVFIGARMHATIGAFSAGVPVIPFSYSRKFEGLFHSLDYDFVINGCETSTDEAIKKTIEWVDGSAVLKEGMKAGEQIIKEKTDYLLSGYEDTIFKNVT